MLSGWAVWFAADFGSCSGLCPGIILYVVPETFAIQALSALGRFGYPTGQGVIWHIRDDPELMKRATATSVHPNVLGQFAEFRPGDARSAVGEQTLTFPRVVAWGLAAILAWGLC